MEPSHRVPVLELARPLPLGVAVLGGEIDGGIE